MNWEDVPGDMDGQSFGEFYKFTKIGQSFTGTLTGRREQVSKYTNDDGSARKEQLFDFQADTGEKYTINAPTDLRRKLEKVPVGTMTKIVYKDDIPLKGFANPMKEFQVQIAKGVPAASPAPSQPDTSKAPF